MDKNIQVANDGSRITLYYNARVFKNLNKPNLDNVEEWASLADKAVKAFSQVSKTLVLKDYEVSDVMLQAVVHKLDGDSKYYTAFDLVDDDAFSKKRYFASRLIGDILYVRMAGFSDDVVDKFAEELKQKNNVKGMILDLRGNTGGSLEAMVKVANMLLDGGVVFESRGRNKTMDLLYEATKGDDFAEKPVVILVDGNTASSAEVLAGTLQEQSRAELVGATTYGKATSQKVIKLPNGSILTLTNAHLSLPSGSSFAEKGLKPDYCLNGGKNVIWDKKSKQCFKEDRSGFEVDIDKALEVLKARI